jgi:hypothetical protein
VAESDAWARWRPEIAKACDGSHHTIESIEQGLEAGVSHALTTETCCYIVEVQDYPVQRACQIMWAAGDLKSILDNLPNVQAWAKLRGCTEMLVEGQPGWARALKPQGYDVWSVTLRRAL